MKKKLLTLVALGASVVLLAGCGNKTPEVLEEDGAVVVEDTTVVEMPEMEENAVTVEAPVVDNSLEGTAE